MTLLDKMKESCTMVDKVTVPDGLGGFIRQWTDGASFTAAIAKDTSVEALRAEQEGVTELYTVVVNKGVELDYHDVFRRNRDGAIFRVTSNIKDSEAHPSSTIQIGKVTAERWELT